MKRLEASRHIYCYAEGWYRVTFVGEPRTGMCPPPESDHAALQPGWTCSFASGPQNTFKEHNYYSIKHISLKVFILCQDVGELHEEEHCRLLDSRNHKYTQFIHSLGMYLAALNKSLMMQRHLFETLVRNIWIFMGIIGSVQTTRI